MTRDPRLATVVTTDTFDAEAEAKTPEVIERGIAFRKKMDREMVSVLRRTALPLFSYSREHDHHWPEGTGMLFKIAGYTFLVSASHVLRAVLPSVGAKGVELHVALNESGAIVAISGVLCGDLSDAIDLGVVELSAASVALLESAQALTLDDIEASEAPPARGWYYVYGFPMVWRRPADVVRHEGIKQIRGRPFSYSTTLFSGSVDGLKGFRPQIHLSVELDPSVTVDGEQRLAETPSDLQGISGCPIWRSFKFGGAAAGWTSSQAKVVAVQTAVYEIGRKHVVRGTKWSVVLELLLRIYPDLAPVLRLQRRP